MYDEVQALSPALYTVIATLPVAETSAFDTTTNPVAHGLRTLTRTMLLSLFILEFVKVNDSLAPAARVVDEPVIWPVIVFEVTALLATVTALVVVSKPWSGLEPKLRVVAVNVIVVPAVTATVEDAETSTLPPLESTIVELVTVIRIVPPPS